MVKSEDEVVKDFNEVVNMTVDELEAFLKTEASETTGLKKDDGSGEAIGHESGRKIVDILKRNPDKDPSKYTDEDKEHMRRVVSYCKRHLAQEAHLKEEKSAEELEKSKSTRSLKNWGHDPLKSSAGAKGGSNKPKSSGKPVSKKAQAPTSKKAEEKKEAAPSAPAAAEAEKPKSSGKPKSTGKPVSKKAQAASGAAVAAAENKEEAPAAKEEKQDAPAEKPKSKGKAGTAATSSAKPTSKKAAETKAAPSAGAEQNGNGKEDAGDKRAADKPADKAEKPASKKAKTEKPVTEGTRKPPSRSAKKA